MPYDNQLRQKAIEFAGDQFERAREIEKEISRLNRRIETLGPQLKAAEAAGERAKTFQALDDQGREMCPACWVRNKRHTVLKPVPSANDVFDWFKCPACHEEFEFQV